MRHMESNARQMGSPFDGNVAAAYLQRGTQPFCYSMSSYFQAVGNSVSIEICSYLKASKMGPYSHYDFVHVQGPGATQSPASSLLMRAGAFPLRDGKQVVSSLPHYPRVQHFCFPLSECTTAVLYWSGTEPAPC